MTTRIHHDDTYHYQCHCHGNVEFILPLQRQGFDTYQY